MIFPSAISNIFPVRIATWEDAAPLEELHAAGITEESAGAMLETKHEGWLCEIEGKVVGFSIRDTTTGELWVNEPRAAGG